MKRIYLIVGEKNSGKSTLVRALTGLDKENEVNIGLSNNTQPLFWAWITSRQEKQQMPKEMIDEMRSINDNRYLHYIIPLHLKGIKGCPDANAYIEELHKNFIIERAVLLGIDDQSISLQLPDVLTINPDTFSANEIAQQVMQEWGWR